MSDKVTPREILSALGLSGAHKIRATEEYEIAFDKVPEGRVLETIRHLTLYGAQTKVQRAAAGIKNAGDARDARADMVADLMKGDARVSGVRVNPAHALALNKVRSEYMALPGTSGEKWKAALEGHAGDVVVALKTLAAAKHGRPVAVKPETVEKLMKWAEAEIERRRAAEEGAIDL